MTKIKPAKGATKDGFRNLKNGSIHKKKHQQKFKNTPTGKVTLIDGSQQKANVKLKHENGKNHQNSPKSSKRSPKGFNKNNGNSKKSPQTKVKIEEEQDDDDSSENDINEGITIKEEVSAPEDEVDDDSSSEDDGAMPDIFGKSLADTTDDDDGEFEADSDEEMEETAENRGVKMFKGLNVKKEPKESSNDDDTEEEDEDDDDDDDEESSDEDVKPALKDLLGASIADESDDEDFEGAEESEDDDDDDEDDSDEEVDQSLNTSDATSSTEEEESSDEDDDDDDDDDDDKATDLTALLGNSLAEDSDDEDFEGNSDDEDDEDDDDDDDDDDDTDDDTPSPGKKIKVMKTEDTDEEDENENNESFDSANVKSEDDDNDEKRARMSKEEREERDSRTIFIGNVPKDTEISRIKGEFKKFGPIENIRIRGIVPENPKIPLKVAAITRKFHEKSTSVCAFVTFKSVESMQKALSMNGKKFDGNYLRVDHCNQNRARDKKRSVFLGNLPFTIEDNDIWDMFKNCGRIESVRIIRDRKTGVGRGFGYVNFETVDGATLALDMNGTTIKNRELRVKVNTPEGKKKQRAEKGKKRQLAESANAGSPKKLKTETSESAIIAKHNSVNAERRKDKKKQKRSQGEKQRIKSESTSPQGKPVGKFQGQKADAKKKSKIDKAAKKKMQIAAKLLAKPKKPSAN